MADFFFDESVGFMLNRTAVILRRELQQAFWRDGQTVTPEQWALLNRLWGQEGLSQVQLADLTFKDKPNVTRMIQVLEKEGVVRRHRDANDRRAYEVRLTPKGRRLEQTLVPLAVEVLDRALRGLEESEIEQLKNILLRIDRNVAE